MNAVDYVMERLPHEEGSVAYPYDDVTGKRVRAPSPNGHITWGNGFNLEECGSPGLFLCMQRYLVDAIETELEELPWYAALDPIRQSACLDIAYNGGEGGLLGFPSMIHFLSIGDWANAAAQCAIKNPQLKSRYDALAQIILTGEVAT